MSLTKRVEDHVNAGGEHTVKTVAAALEITPTYSAIYLSRLARRGRISRKGIAGEYIYLPKSEPGANTGALPDAPAPDKQDLPD